MSKYYNNKEQALAQAKAYLIQGKYGRASVCKSVDGYSVIVNPNFINALFKKQSEGGLPADMSITEVFK